MTEIPAISANCWILTGPTASGKTAVGIELARLLGAEIISLDSMAVFQSMDIGTAKPTPEEQRQVPHHLIDIVRADEEFSLAQYLEAAHRTVAEISARGRVPLFVGGTPLYLKALLRGIFEGPPADWELRKQLRAWADDEGPAALHQRLAEVDPRSAARLHPHDARRIIRALEVWEKVGRPISELQQQFERAEAALAPRVAMLDWPVDELNRRIDQRVDQMFGAGLVLEVSRLSTQMILSRTALQGVGYGEVLAHLRGEVNIVETKELVKIKTRQFAKRQRTWFRSIEECLPINPAGLPVLQVAEEIVRLLA